MRSRSRLTLAAFAMLSVLVVGTGLAWACTPAEGGVDDSSGSPGDRTTFHGRYFAPNEPVDVRWNRPHENSPTAPLLATAQADGNGLLTFTVTIPQADPGTYWIVVNGPGGNGQGGISQGDTRFRAAAGYTIEGATAPQEPNPAPQEPEQSDGRAPANEPASDPKAPNSASSSAGREGTATPVASTSEPRESGAPAAAGVAAPAAGDAAAAREPARRQDAQQLPPGARRHDPRMAPVSPWSGVSSGEEGAPAPTLVPATNEESTTPLSYLGTGAFILGAGLVLMFAGFFVADIRRTTRPAEVEADRERTELSS